MLYIYRDLCPQCGGDLHSEEAESGFCKNKNIPLCHYSADIDVKEFLEFFREAVGEPTSLQKMWARRILSGESFAAVAPTGIGKTTFGIAMSVFLASSGKRCYLLFPTSLLAEQSFRKLLEICEKTKVKFKVNCGDGDGLHVMYYRKMKKTEREKFFEELKEGKDSILITTSQFLVRNFSRMKCCYNFIFVDDVDSILKASKNVDRILQLLGFRYAGKWMGKAEGSLMVSTATAKKGKKARLFMELLNFDVGSSYHSLRNVEDIVVEDDSVETLCNILDRMGDGGLLYTSSREEAEEIYECLKDSYKVGLAGKTENIYEEFESGELEYIIGTSYYYGTLVRGLDLPERIKFVVFINAPVFTIKVDDVDAVSDRMLKILRMVFRIPDELSDEEAKEEIKRSMSVGKEIVDRDICLRKGELIFPDIRTYVQGSGRTSRLFSGGITKGASFLLESDRCIREAFLERSKHFNIEFKKINEVDFNKLRKEIEESRKGFRRAVTDLIKPALFIVESPTKAKQISRFFGKPSIKVMKGIVAYEVPSSPYVLSVSASLGHVTDLTTEGGFHGVEIKKSKQFIPIYSPIKRCRECGYQFTGNALKCPKCGSENVDNSSIRISSLRKLAHDAGFVIIGTDPDSEGEKIAWDIKCLLSNCGEIKRAEFHEITPKAVINALNNLRDVNLNLVKAQIVRRIEDRWIGFELSQKLWNVFGSKNLSAGRAQTPVLGWIIDRYYEHKKKKRVLVLKDLELSIELGDVDLKEKEKIKVKTSIHVVDKKVEERVPLPPYTTDTMLRDVNSILGISAADAMKLAQELFERGLITYHRTDSTRVSEAGWRVAREWLGDDFQAREWFAEGAHECIRPTRPVDKNTLRRLVQEGIIPAEGMSWRHYALYDLIFRRFMASQCKNYIVEIVIYKIILNLENKKEIFEERVVGATGRAYELYKAVKIKRPLPEGDMDVIGDVRLVPLKPLLTQSELIQMMKERGIGRPSTYSTIIEKLFQRNYIVEKNGRLIPTKKGIDVYGYLVRNYRDFVSEERTRKLEEKMDAVEMGKVDYTDVLRELYDEIKSI
ncbi:MAG: reverse gyrase [Archaeoglobus sp.]|nr:MAG: reverse gyrase [Archaeoglobus sp.]